MLSDKYFNFITPVWGESYTRLFTDICLPMLLTPGNLYARAYREHDKFTIVTTWECRTQICHSDAFKALSKLISVNFILIDSLVDLQSNVYYAMSYCYSKAMAQPYIIPTKTYFIFLTPDSFWSEGTFKKLYELAADDYYVTMAMGLRVNAESVANEISEYTKQQHTPFSMSNNQLIPLVFNNLHQMSKAHNLLTSNFLNGWPSHLYWINTSEMQLVAHCFHLHPLMVRSPEKKVAIGKSIDAQFLDNLDYPLEKYHVFTENYFGIELSVAKRSWNQSLERPSINKIIKFSLLHAHKKHWHFFNKRIVIGHNTSIEPCLETLINETISQVPCLRLHLRDKLFWREPFLSIKKIPIIMFHAFVKAKRNFKIRPYKNMLLNFTSKFTSRVKQRQYND